MTDNRWTEDSVLSQTGRTAVVTGGNTGLGFEVARVLASRGAAVVLAVRNLDKGKDAATRIASATPGADVTVQRFDASSLASVRTAAEELRARHDTIDLLINNAGLMYPPRGSTEDGFELQFGTNYLGHFALTGLLLDRMLPVAGSRIMTISSIGHRIRAAIHFDDLQWERRYDRVAAYGQANLAKLMFTYELQRRLAAAAASTIAVGAHPGFANTAIGQYLPGPINVVLGRIVSQPPEMGALPLLRAATDPAAVGGQYYGPGGFLGLSGHPVIAKSSAQSHDTDQQRRLWKVSQELTGVIYPI